MVRNGLKLAKNPEKWAKTGKTDQNALKLVKMVKKCLKLRKTSKN